MNFVRSILKRFTNKKIIVNKKNLGVATSRNIAIKNSKGKYIAFIDSDDIWHRNKLLHQINIMEKSKIDLSYTSYDVVDKRNKLIKKKIVSQNISL